MPIGAGADAAAAVGADDRCDFGCRVRSAEHSLGACVGDDSDVARTTMKEVAGRLSIF